MNTELLTEIAHQRAAENNFDFDDRAFWLTDIKGTFLGDVNLDRTVDADDLNTLGLNWRRTTATSWSQGDFNGDGNVDASDLNDLGLNWRNSAEAPASTTSVPEPAAIVLLALGFAFAIRPRASWTGRSERALSRV